MPSWAWRWSCSTLPRTILTASWSHHVDRRGAAPPPPRRRSGPQWRPVSRHHHRWRPRSGQGSQRDRTSPGRVRRPIAIRAGRTCGASVPGSWGRTSRCWQRARPATRTSAVSPATLTWLAAKVSPASATLCSRSTAATSSYSRVVGTGSSRAGCWPVTGRAPRRHCIALPGWSGPATASTWSSSTTCSRTTTGSWRSWPSWRSAAGLPTVVTNEVHYAEPGGHRLQDVLVCIRHGATLDEARELLLPQRRVPAQERGRSWRASAPGCRTTRRPARRGRTGMAQAAAIGRPLPGSTWTSSAIGFRASRSPRARRRSHTSYQLAHEGLRRRYRPITPSSAVKQLAHELEIIERTNLAEFFLIVLGPDGVRARARDHRPGAGKRRRLDRGLLPGHHQGRPDRAQAPLRALHQRGADAARTSTSTSTSTAARR